MEIGITAELQKKLGIKDLPKPTGDNLFFLLGCETHKMR